MNRGSLWMVAVIAVAWIGFLLGYSVSAHTGSQAVAAAKPVAGGYGCIPEKGSGTRTTPEPKQGAS